VCSWGLAVQSSSDPIVKSDGFEVAASTLRSQLLILQVTQKPRPRPDGARW
jgi:hypothetical protein